MPHDRRPRLGISDPGAQRQHAGGLDDGMQFFKVPDIDHRPHVTHEFGDPQPHIRGAADQRRAGVRRIDRRQIVDRPRHDDAVLALADIDGRPIVQRNEPRLHRLAMHHQRIGRRRAIARHREPRPHDRRITGAAAEITLQRLLDAVDRGFRVGHPQSIERHHDARRAEAALAAVKIHHRLLYRMQRPARRRQMLDGHHMRPMQRADKGDARVDRLVAEPIRAEPPDQHRARTAIALGAAFLGAAQPLGQPQIVEQRLGGAEIGELNLFVVEDEPEGVARTRHQLPRYVE